MNFIPAKVGDSGMSLVLDLPGSQVLDLDVALQPGRTVLVGIRPEHLAIASPDVPGLDVPIAAIESTGATTFVTTQTTPEIVFVQNGRSLLDAGQAIRLGFALENVHLFDVETEQRLGD